MTPDQRARLERLVEQQAHGPLTLRDGEVMYGSDTVLDLAAALAHIDALEARVESYGRAVVAAEARAEQAEALLEAQQRETALAHAEADAFKTAKEQAEAERDRLREALEDVRGRAYGHHQQCAVWRGLLEADCDCNWGAVRARLHAALVPAAAPCACWLDSRGVLMPCGEHAPEGETR